MSNIGLERPVNGLLHVSNSFKKSILKNIVKLFPIFVFCSALFGQCLSPDFVAAQQKKNSGSLFDYNLALNSVPGLPSSLSLSSKQNTIKQSRVFLLLDGELLVLPLTPSEEEKGKLSVSFPTPRESLSFQFQGIDSGKNLVLSETTFVDLSCPKNHSQSIIDAKAKDAAHKEAIEKAHSKEKDSRLLSYTIKILQSIAFPHEQGSNNNGN